MYVLMSAKLKVWDVIEQKSENLFEVLVRQITVKDYGNATLNQGIRG